MSGSGPSLARPTPKFGQAAVSVLRFTQWGSLLLPVRDAAAPLAYEAHAPVLGDHDRHRSGQRAAQTVGRAVASADVPGPLFSDFLAFEVQRPPHALDLRQPAGDPCAPSAARSIRLRAFLSITALSLPNLACRPSCVRVEGVPEPRPKTAHGLAALPRLPYLIHQRRRRAVLRSAPAEGCAPCRFDATWPVARFTSGRRHRRSAAQGQPAR